MENECAAEYLDTMNSRAYIAAVHVFNLKTSAKLLFFSDASHARADGRL